MNLPRAERRNLDPDKIVETIRILRQRIDERFPDSGLAEVCLELLETARTTRERARWIARPNVTLRVLTAGFIVSTIAGLVYSILSMELTIGKLTLADVIQVSEAGLNDIVLIGAAIFFLVSIENRLKRSRALEVLHELRSIAHVIDMHQLTKGPAMAGSQRLDTRSSPRRSLSHYELIRYLDYCSEMLSLTGKVAALFAQYLNDAIVLAAVNELETLTTGLSRKIWQKIMMFRTMSKQTFSEA